MLEFRCIEKTDKEIFFKFLNEFYASSAVLHNVPADNFNNTFNDLMNNSPYQACYMLEYNEKIVGYALLSFSWSNEAGGKVVWIEEVYIEKSFRGKGIFKKLFAFLQNEYKDVSRFRLETEKENRVAYNLYKSLGFKELDYTQLIKE